MIVPLYKRIDLIEHQLAQFAPRPGDPRASTSSTCSTRPSSREELLRLRRTRCTALHDLPLRLVLLKRNAGFSGANNARRSVARGRPLAAAELRRDSRPARVAGQDVGVLRRDARHRRARAQAAATRTTPSSTPGCTSTATPGSRLWGNQHYFKGLHRSFPAANVARPVPGVTAACMMVDRDLYEEVGGLSHAYVQGGYEDSDLCLRLIELGRQQLVHARRRALPPRGAVLSRPSSGSSRPTTTCGFTPICGTTASRRSPGSTGRTERRSEAWPRSPTCRRDDVARPGRGNVDDPQRDHRGRGRRDGRRRRRGRRGGDPAAPASAARPGRCRSRAGPSGAAAPRGGWSSPTRRSGGRSPCTTADLTSRPAIRIRRGPAPPASRARSAL